MQKYITQLITILEEAKGNKPEKSNARLLYPDHPALEYGLDYIAERECAPSVQMGELFGVDVAVFPDASRLSTPQIEQLVAKMLDLWAEFNICADYPAKVPPHLLYEQLVNYWKHESVQYISEGMLHIEFCHYDTKACPWGSDYCTCKHFGED